MEELVLKMQLIIVIRERIYLAQSQFPTTVALMNHRFDSCSTNDPQFLFIIRINLHECTFFPQVPLESSLIPVLFHHGKINYRYQTE
jgi:hypothetical protein